MAFSRYSDIQHSCIQAFTIDSSRYFAIVSDDILEANLFVKDLITKESLWSSNIAFFEESSTKDPSSSIEQVLDKEVLVFLGENTWDYEFIRSIVESKKTDSKIILTSQTPIQEPEATVFPIPRINFREYAESTWLDLSTPSLLKNNTDHTLLASTFENYIRNGAYPYNHMYADEIWTFFHNKIAIINEELFKKEWDVFLNFVRTLAMNIGELYKADALAKTLGISRRKVHKYTELLLKHNIITGIGPFIEDESVELSRHVKIYFKDLSYYHAALWVTYFIGITKQPIIENFVLLELTNRLWETHDIRFWRKKSGTEIQFVLINKENKKLTPIEITTRWSEIVSKAMKSFYESYDESIEYGMFLNESIIRAHRHNDKTFLVLPYAAI